MGAIAGEKKPIKIDIYDEEFVTNLELAKNLLDQVTHPREKEICKKWITKLCGLKNNDVLVKKNRNSFFKYFLRILHKGVQAAEGQVFSDSLTDKDKKGGVTEDRDFMCRWSNDKRTYIAAKPLPGQGTLVYMAVAKDVSLGWEKNGLTTFI